MPEGEMSQEEQGEMENTRSDIEDTLEQDKTNMDENDVIEDGSDDETLVESDDMVDEQGDNGLLEESELTENRVMDVLDLSEPESEDMYTTGLVVVLEEADYWRVVDRQGYVYRISSSATIEVGDVLLEAQVFLDDEGNRRVELSGDKQSFDDTVVDSTGWKQAGQNIGEALFKEYAHGKSLDSIKKTQDIGRGIKQYRLEVVTEDGERKSYQYTLYGYEDTWLMPSLSYVGEKKAGEEQVQEDMAEEDMPEEDISKSTEETTSETITAGTTRRKELYTKETTTYYIEKKFLPQSDMTQGTNTWEYMTNIYVEDGAGKRQLIHKGKRNNDFIVLKTRGQRVYLKSEGWAPASERYTLGLGFLDLTDKTYKVLHNGGIVEGFVDGDVYYYFAEKQLHKLTFATGKTEAIVTLPYSIEESDLEVLQADQERIRIRLEKNKVQYYDIQLNDGVLEEIHE